MRVDELRRAGEYLRNNPPVEPAPVHALEHRAARRRRRQRAAMAAVLLVGRVGGGVLLAGVGDRRVVEAPGQGDDPWASGPDPAGAPPAVVIAPDAAPVPPAGEPSQPHEDAARDRVHPDVARLADPDRSNRLVALAADEGYWVPSRAPMSFDQLGDPDGDYGIDRIFLPEYGEILLLDETGRIAAPTPCRA